MTVEKMNISNDWKTPEKLYNRLNAEFHFDFDPCPYRGDLQGPLKDGLKIEWGQRNYVNPPYDRNLKEAFVRRGVEMQKRGKLCVFLLPVSTSTNLFHNVIVPNATEIRFLKKRIHFAGYNSDGKWVTGKCGRFDSMIVVFGKNHNLTLDEWKTWYNFYDTIPPEPFSTNEDPEEWAQIAAWYESNLIRVFNAGAKVNNKIKFVDYDL